MSEPIKLEDLPKTVTGSMYRQNKVILCDRCKGFGFTLDEELTDYHKREYTTTRNECKKCDGDGRMIECTEHFSLNVGNPTVTTVSYDFYKNIIDPHFYDDRWVRFRLDLTDWELERKYPELAAVNYDNYDKLVEHYRTIEILKKEETR